MAKITGTKENGGKGDDEKKKVHKRPAEYIGAEEAPTFYSNSIKLQNSLYDFQISFSNVLEATPEKFSARVVATVLMSPQHAKVFSRILQRNVEKYEQQFGPIPVSEEDSAPAS